MFTYPPVKFMGRRTMKEKTDIFTMHRRASRWKRRKIRESNPIRFIIFQVQDTFRYIDDTK